jgi:hypothetical protein
MAAETNLETFYFWGLFLPESDRGFSVWLSAGFYFRFDAASPQSVRAGVPKR